MHVYSELANACYEACFGAVICCVGGPCAASSELAMLYNSDTGLCDRHGGITTSDTILPYHLLLSTHQNTIANFTNSSPGCGKLGGVKRRSRFWFDYNTVLVEYQTIFYNGFLGLITRFKLINDVKMFKDHVTFNGIAERIYLQVYVWVVSNHLNEQIVSKQAEVTTTF